MKNDCPQCGQDMRMPTLTYKQFCRLYSIVEFLSLQQKFLYDDELEKQRRKAQKILEEIE